MGLWTWGFGNPGEETEHWAFVADFAQYTGGIERPFAAWLIGEADEYANEDDLIELFNKEFPKDSPVNGLIASRICDPGDDGYHRAPMDLAPTPGRVNNGMGKCQNAPKVPKKTYFPAFESVAIFLDRRPTAKELRFLTERAMRFHLVPTTKKFDERPQVLRCRLVREVTRLESFPAESSVPVT